MIPNCSGCEEEFRMACDGIKNEGLHFATTKECCCGLGEKGKHLFLILVDNDGNVVII